MLHTLQNTYTHVFTVPIDANGTTVTDTEFNSVVSGVKYESLRVIVVMGNVAANMTALKLQESDASGSGEADITGAAWTSPTAAAGDNKVYVCDLDLRKRKQYISLVATAGAGATLIAAFGIAYNPVLSPTSATEAGITGELKTLT